MRSPKLPGDLERDPRFPSGEWSGFYLEPGSPKRHWTVFYLEFRGGQLRGEGNDYVGAFHLSGQYDTSSGLCQWTKQYLGRHEVAYERLNGGQGIIGRWIKCLRDLVMKSSSSWVTLTQAENYSRFNGCNTAGASPERRLRNRIPSGGIVRFRDQWLP